MKRIQKGFTLIELLVVIAIIGILPMFLPILKAKKSQPFEMLIRWPLAKAFTGSANDQDGIFMGDDQEI